MSGRRTKGGPLARSRAWGPRALAPLVTALLTLASVAADGRAQADGAPSGPLVPSASFPSFTPTLRSEISTEAVVGAPQQKRVTLAAEA